MNLTVPSFAKINWNLKVLGKRPDGFHELWTVFQQIDLSDSISFAQADALRLEVAGNPLPAGRGNLVLKAAALLQDVTGYRGGARMVLTKAVPVAAGLGGGSANAATTLLALNHLWGCNLSKRRLEEVAAGLGSDVAFFLTGGMAAGTGRGEEIEPVDDCPEPLELLVVNPGPAISTAAVYSAAEFPPLDRRHRLTSSDRDTRIQRLHRVLSGEESGVLENDLEKIVFSRTPILKTVKETLLQAGCRQALLCGSGSCLFALGGRDALRSAAEACRSRSLGELFPCRTLSRKEYWRRLHEVGIKGSD